MKRKNGKLFKLILRVSVHFLFRFFLQLILKSTKLFVTTEWQVYKALCIWLYLHLNPKQDILPAWTTIVSFFANYTGSDFIMPSPTKTM